MKGGAKLEKVLYTMAAKLKSAKVVKVGFLEGAAYPSGIPVAAVAAFQDFGTRRIPPRPFFRNMISTKSPGWPKAIATTLKSTGYDAKKTLELVGEGVVGQLKQSIVDTNSPPLAESTIRWKGFAKPLIASSHMINSADKEVN